MRAVNLLPRDEPRRQRERMALPTQLAMVLPFVVASLIAAGYLLASSKVNDNKATLNALLDELAVIPHPENEQPGNALLAVQRDQRVAALGLALQARISWDRILREISSVLPEDVWLSSLDAKSPDTTVPPPAPTETTTTTTTTESSGDTTAATTTPAPPPPPAAPLDLHGYTYSQEGVARLMSRLALIPELDQVKLVSSTETQASGRMIVQFSIQANVATPGAS
jgi:Tfp pilus assembly protein PilN